MQSIPTSAINLVSTGSLDFLTNTGLQITIRESRRAKHLRLQVSIDKGVEIIAPPGFPWMKLPELLQEKRAWLSQSIQRIEQERQQFPEAFTQLLPTSISLPAIAQTWSIEYDQASSQTTSKSIRVAQDYPGQLILSGGVHDQLNCQAALRRWLARQAQQHLIPWLDHVSQTTHLNFSKGIIKGQRTRWASCSSQKRINLNYKLLFATPEIVEYVLIHELCHTVHLNHSAEFWALVHQHCPTYRHWDQQLNQTWRRLPLWVR
jgi:predicted metal-dependent hydrolase